MKTKTINHSEFKKAIEYGHWSEIGIDNFMNNAIYHKESELKKNIVKKLLTLLFMGLIDYSTYFVAISNCDASIPAFYVG